MKMKDLKPGMTVAQRPDSWNLYAPPARLVVLSTEYHNGKRTYSRTSDEREVTFTVTADDNGKQHRVRTPVYTPGGADKAKVLVLNTTNGNRVEWLTPAQVEGPYLQVRDERADTRLRQEKARVAGEARRRAEIERMKAVEEGLKRHEISAWARDNSEYGYSTDLVLPLDVAEALLARLDGEG